MPMIIRCPSCDSSLTVSEEKRGKKIDCPKCTYGFKAGPPPVKGPPPAPVDDDEPYFPDEVIENETAVRETAAREAVTHRPRQARRPEPVHDAEDDDYDRPRRTRRARQDDDAYDDDDDVECDRPRRVRKAKRNSDDDHGPVRVKDKAIQCKRCDTRFSQRLLRCPGCDAPNTKAAGTGLTKHDRLIAAVLIVLGIISGVVLTFLLIAAVWLGGPRGIAGAAGLLLLMVFPLGLLLHGILLLAKIHPKDFYAWWENLPVPIRRGFWALVALIILVFFIVFFLSGNFPAKSTLLDPTRLL